MGVISNGTTLLDAGALDSGVPAGSMTLIKTLTASGSSTLNFVNGASSVVFDGTYKQYLIKYINIHASVNETWFQFQGSIDGGSNYNVATTSTVFVAHNRESGGNQGLNYYDGRDNANGTDYTYLAGWEQGIDNDQATSGSIKIFNPADTTFVKHFTSNCNIAHPSDFTANSYAAGYFNTTSAINAISFRMTSGNIDTGTIKLYGVKS
jgi:hypothetical protein